MSATGFHPEPSAKAPWTRTTVLTAAYAGDDAARAAPVKRARIKRFMVQLHVEIRVVSYFGALPMNFEWRSFYARHELRFASIPILSTAKGTCAQYSYLASCSTRGCRSAM